MRLEYKIETKSLNKFIKKNLRESGLASSQFSQFANYPIENLNLLIAVPIIFMGATMSNIVVVQAISLLLTFVWIVLAKKSTTIFEYNSLIKEIMKRDNIIKNTVMDITDESITIIREDEKKVFYYYSISGVYISGGYVIIDTRQFDRIYIPEPAFVDKSELKVFIDRVRRRAGVEAKDKFPRECNMYSI